jgi:ABC-2 type transport system permease protein
MSRAAVVLAQKDFADAARSKLLWGAILVLVVVTVPDYLTMIDSPVIDSAGNAVEFIPMIFVNFVAPLAMIIGHRAVVGERESGSIRVLFGHPLTRRDLVVGKVLGRGALTGVLLVAAMLVLGIVTLVSYGTVPVLLFLGVSLYVVLYGVVWTGVTVGISAAVASRLRAITAVLGLFLFFGPFQLWSRLAVPAAALLFTGSPSTNGIDTLQPSTWPVWYEYVLRLNPMENFELGRYVVSGLVTNGSHTGVSGTLALFGIATLLLWFAVPIVIGYWRFEGVDIQ